MGVDRGGLADRALRVADEQVGRRERAVARIEDGAAGKRGDVADIAGKFIGRRLQFLDLARRGVDAEHRMFERVLRGDVKRLAVGRSEERRVGKESVSTGRSGWWPYVKKKIYTNSYSQTRQTKKHK